MKNYFHETKSASGYPIQNTFRIIRTRKLLPTQKEGIWDSRQSNSKIKLTQVKILSSHPANSKMD